VVIVHGFGSHRGDPAAGALGLAKDLHGEGFGVLAFDMRGCGRSGGRGGSAGYHERSDLLGALGLLAKRGAHRRRTGVLGFSLGGAVAITACMRPGVAGGVVADSSFADLWEIIRANATGLRRPAAWFHTGMDTFARWMYGINIAEVSPVTAVAGSQTPLLIIHGDRNPVVPAVHARMLWEAARRDARRDGGGASRRDEAGQARALELWLAPGAGHVQAYHTLREEYVRRVSDFFTRTLGCRTGLSQR
jgi:pimeloyl-ACP methyl ester carboxylesterase